MQLTSAPHVLMVSTHLLIHAKKFHQDAMATIRIQATVLDVWLHLSSVKENVWMKIA